ncbi:MAG: hypothetical protein PHV34_15635 [Verrucomicrobiae bacterium]|nr:hypothetical protein [Verrucomicrobiae bacterium]
MKSFLLFLGLSIAAAAVAQQKIPDPLRTWEDWAVWDEPHYRCPTAFNAADRFFCCCPSDLSLQTNAKDGRFSLGVTVFHKTWFALPGDTDLWPLNVQANGKPIAVIERSGRPSVLLSAGTHRLTGDYRWAEMPQKIRAPAECGMVSLTVEGKPSSFPSWDAEGFLWLKRHRTEEGDKDFLGVQVYRMIEDGIPMWLHTVVELSVSGKSREVELGNALPEGWSLSSVESPIPVAVDEQGMAKAQVRAGKWLVQLRAFRTMHPADFKMKPTARPMAERELICFKADPEFRMLDIHNATPVDATQTTFPEKWRKWPVYQWQVKTALAFEEKMRGSGLQTPKSLSATRELWLNEKGRGYTYRDHLSGEMQNLWRLDVSTVLQLGSVKVNGEGQLITRNPQNNATGVEIRSRNIQLDAVGTSATMRTIPATGWNANMDSLTLKLNLPPGWRLLALFGAEKVNGDWLTSWTLLDLFLLLIFSLAVSRLWGMGAGIVAFLAFGLTYHEPGSPCYTWLFLLLPLALLKVIPEGKMRKFVTLWKNTALLILLFVLVPFVYWQIQSVIYPQLEKSYDGSLQLGIISYCKKSEPLPLCAAPPPPPAMFEKKDDEGFNIPDKSGFSSVHNSNLNLKSVRQVAKKANYQQQANLAYEPKARIQTGPGVPEWRWRSASCHWQGPVSASQNITPVLLSPWARKILVLAGLALIFRLIVCLLEIKIPPFPLNWLAGRKTIVLIGLGLLLGGSQVTAQSIPDKETLETLKKRLLKQPDCYPHCAEIPFVSLQIREDKISFDAQIDAAIQTALPLPGRLPAWSPIKTQIDGRPEAAVRRVDGYLWMVVPEGSHRVKVEGLLPGVREWEWNFLLKPRNIAIDAPDWNITGLRRDGTPEQQIFFSRKQAAGEKQTASSDQREFNTLAVVDRVLEIGLTWQIHNTVTRLSAPGKAIALKIPLLAGEQVLSANVTLNEGNVEARLAAGQESFSWESELSPAAEIKLAASQTDRWVERWRLVSSPVWNITLAGLPPVFETNENQLAPVWHPWPGENVGLGITRPEAVNGPTMTIHRVIHETELGHRNRNDKLYLTLQCSVGDDLVIGLDPATEVTSVKRGQDRIPVRREGGKLIVPVQPGMQNLEIDWKEAMPLGLLAVSSRLELPAESSNITTVLRPPFDRWILWTYGPLRGPAVRFWGVLACSLIAAWGLGFAPLSPLTRKQWALLMVGLTQVHLVAALFVIGWLFILAHRSTDAMVQAKPKIFNFRQIVIVIATAIALGIFLTVVYQGLLGNPEMFILGNGSLPRALHWYAAQAPATIPQPGMISVSVWFYRILMLLWALWLSCSLIRWLSWGWKQFNTGGWWKQPAKPPVINKN